MKSSPRVSVSRPGSLHDTEHGGSQCRPHVRGLVLAAQGLEDDVFTLHGSLALALVLAAWMHAALAGSVPDPSSTLIVPAALARHGRDFETSLRR